MKKLKEPKRAFNTKLEKETYMGIKMLHVEHRRSMGIVLDTLLRFLKEENLTPRFNEYVGEQKANGRI